MKMLFRGHIFVGGSCSNPGTWLRLMRLEPTIAYLRITPHPAWIGNYLLLWGMWPFTDGTAVEDLGGGNWKITGLLPATDYHIRAGHLTTPSDGTCSDVRFTTPQS